MRKGVTVRTAGIPFRSRAAAVALALAVSLGGRAALAQTIKVGSLAPVGSSWDTTLRRITAEWSRLSGGRVRIVTYPGGIVGDEPDMIRKMRIGQLQGAAMTAVGIGRIHPPVLSVGFPLLVRTDEEIDLLLERMSPDFDRGIEASGYKLVAWSTSGWVYYYARRPVSRPDDLKAIRLWLWEGADSDELATWRSLGFQVVPLKATDVLIALQSGMIDAACVSPIAAAAYQWFALVPNMMDLKWSPLYGGLVLTRSAWQQLPADLRPALLKAAREIGGDMNAANRENELQAVEVMKSHGLKITQPAPQDVALWEQVVAKAAARIVGRTIDRSSYEKAAAELRSIRAGEAKP